MLPDSWVDLIGRNCKRRRCVCVCADVCVHLSACVKGIYLLDHSFRAPILMR